MKYKQAGLGLQGNERKNCQTPNTSGSAKGNCHKPVQAYDILQPPWKQENRQMVGQGRKELRMSVTVRWNHLNGLSQPEKQAGHCLGDPPDPASTPLCLGS